MDIIKAVKKLGNKLTGETYTSKDLVKLIDEIADDYSGGGGGGGAVTKINITQDESYNLVMDKTFAEIQAAMMIGYCYTYQEFPEPNPGSSILVVSQVNGFADSYQVVCGTFTYETSSEDGYPTWAG